MHLSSGSSKVGPEEKYSPPRSPQENTTPSKPSVIDVDENEVSELSGGGSGPLSSTPSLPRRKTGFGTSGLSTRSLVASAVANIQETAVAGSNQFQTSLRRSLGHSISKGGSTSAEDIRRKDLENFRPAVRRRVRTQELARTRLSVRMLLLLEEREDHWAAGGVQLVVTAVVYASIILLGLQSAEPSDAMAINRADLGCAAFLLAEWLIRCWLHVAMRCTSCRGADVELGVLAARSHAPWLVVDGVASLSHSATAVAAMWFGGGGKVTGFSMLAGFRLLRLLSLVRYSATLDLIAAVMKQSLYALKGPIYLLGVSAVYVGAAIYYAEQLGDPSATDFDNMFDALWFSWVTFSTVGYGDLGPITPLGKLITMLGIGIGMLWFAMPISIVGSTFTEEWHRRNVRRVSDALQTELLQQGLMTNGLHKKFLEIDTDGSGTLDEEEFVRFLKSMSHRRLKYMGPTESRAMFSMMDPDHGGTISYKELVRVVFPGIDITTHLFWKTSWAGDASTESKGERSPSSHALHGAQCGKHYLLTRPQKCKDLFKAAMVHSGAAKKIGEGTKSKPIKGGTNSRVTPLGGSAEKSAPHRAAAQSPPKSTAATDFELSEEPEKEMELTSREVVAGLRAQVQSLQAGQDQMLARIEAVVTAVDRLASRSGGIVTVES